ncbi:ABC transporter permease [Clostridium botulinum]|uniref:Membrane protein n=1 Tax=Clostridium botulinum TaxID=1491 RepID=A0A9Q1V011_CLOBO|nr:ABC transporter permease [Clostridium botulinum]AEB75270.1 putative transmembrane protein [Clostridium botulinum BKT015925]KEI03244.1 membrane protein [Clostridium botulinum C/D str. Sp77]KEI03273.1 membrane protein [Clostridium botulinum D str. 16868]KLU76488.1 membrane protein [Clostridium botulinum V891]KOA79063.1 membrane protein [Clostridium botulinum]
MFNLLKVEIYKLKTSKTLLGILLICLLQSILCPMLFSKTLTGKIVLIRVLGTQLFLGWFVLIAVFIAIYIGDEFSSSCSSGYIKNLISYGHRRYKIVISKFISGYLGIIIISLVTPILVTIINTFMCGYGENFTFTSLVFVLRVIILMTFIYIGIGSIGIVMLFISRNGIFAEVAFVMVDILNRVSMIFAMRNTFINKIYSNTIFGQVSTALSYNITLLQGIRVIVISLITIVISICLSIYFFNKADIK